MEAEAEVAKVFEEKKWKRKWKRCKRFGSGRRSVFGKKFAKKSRSGSQFFLKKILEAAAKTIFFKFWKQQRKQIFFF